MFDFALAGRQINVDGGEFVDPGTGFFSDLFSNPLTAKSLQAKPSPRKHATSSTHRFIVAPDLLNLSSKSLDFPLRCTELIQGNLELPLNLVVVGTDFGKLKGLLLDGLLQVDVELVGGVQGHLKLGDLDLELLLDAGDLGLEPSLGLDHTSVKLFNFDAGGLAANKT